MRRIREANEIESMFELTTTQKTLLFSSKASTKRARSGSHACQLAAAWLERGGRPSPLRVDWGCVETSYASDCKQSRISRHILRGRPPRTKHKPAAAAVQ